MAIVKASIHGAISIVNAIATGKGATLGISKKVDVEMETTNGSGIIIEIQNKPMKSRLINRVVQKIIPKNELSKIKLRISVNSEIPTGYGLKSSSAISTAVAMASAKLFKPKMNDFEILSVGVDASIETKVSLTGAYDDACACYYGGFVVTDNYKKKISILKNVLIMCLLSSSYLNQEREEMLENSEYQVILLNRLGIWQKNLIIGMP